MKSEKRIEQEILLKASELGAVLFKNNVGVYVPLTYFNELKKAIMAGNLQLAKKLIRNPDIRSVGLANGSSDLIGIAPVKITPEMVGQTLGVFLSIEVKKDKKGSYQATKEQKRWLAMVEKKGGIGAVLDNAVDLERLLEKKNI